MVNTTLHGNDGVAPEDILGYTGVTLPGSIKTTSSLVKKDIQIGNLTEVATGSNTGGLSDYDFKLTQNNAQGTLATIKATAEGNTSVAAVTGNGLAVLDVTSGALVDLEKGQVISTRTEGSLNKQPATELTAYNDAKDARVVEFGGKYYEVKGTDLVAYEGDTSDKSLTKVGKGTADQITGGLNVTSTNTGLVSNQNVHYGESVTKQANAGQLTISSTNPEVANSTSGNQFAITSDAPTTTSSKDVKTGIIATDKDGNKTYGLQATNVVDNKVTAQTTLTAEGITTTGDIKFIGEDGKETSVKNYLDATSKDVDARVKDAVESVKGQTAGLNSRINQLNNRVDDVEKTSYRGIAIALAAQQQIPNIGAGQTAVFGGVGHYEGESAAALGLVTVLADGRTSLSAALGVAGGSEVGGRVGVAYVFGGK